MGINAMARPAGLEPTTTGLEGRCSIQLSYGRVEACILGIAQGPLKAAATVSQECFKGPRNERF